MQASLNLLSATPPPAPGGTSRGPARETTADPATQEETTTFEIPEDNPAGPDAPVAPPLADPAVVSELANPVLFAAAPATGGGKPLPFPTGNPGKPLPGTLPVAPPAEPELALPAFDPLPDWQPRPLTTTVAPSGAIAAETGLPAATLSPTSSPLALAAPVAVQTTVAQPLPAEPAPAMPTYNVDAEVGKTGWDDAFSARVLNLAGNGISRASLQLNPAHLGPVEIAIAVKADEVSVTFQAVNGVTREAIEQALPRLRDMLGDAGLNLANADVSAQSQHDAQTADDTGSRGDSGPESLAETALDALESIADSQAKPLGLLDIYA